MDEAAAYFLTMQHDVVSVDDATGTIRWRSATGGSGSVPTGTVVRLAPSRVIVGDASVIALDSASGRQVWRYEAPDGDDPGVFLGGVDTDLVAAGSPMGRLYALDAKRGSLRWRREVAPGERRAVFAPVLSGDMVIAAFTTFDGPLAGGLVALDRHGVPRWTHRFDAGIGAAGPPVVAGDAIVTARTDGGIEALRPASGRRVWRLPPEPGVAGGVSGRDIRALAAQGDTLIVTSLSGAVRAYDVPTQRQRWARRDGPADAVALRVRAFGSHVYVPYTDGSLVALDLATGTEIWRTDAADPSYDWPPAASETSIFAAGSRALYAFDNRGRAASPGRASARDDR